MRNAWLVMAVLGFAVGPPADAEPTVRPDLVTSKTAGSDPATSDEIVEQIDVARAYYTDGDVARALNELEFALNSLRRRFSHAFMATLPRPPALWSAEKPALDNSAALFGGGLMVTRRYLEEKGDGRIKAELIMDSPLVPAFSAIFASPIMIANDPDLERVRLGGTTALLNWNADQQAGDVFLSLGGRVLVKLAGQDLDDKSVLVELMRTWDLDAVRTIAGLR